MSSEGSMLGRVVSVTANFTDFRPDQGYLVLEPGQQVIIQYRGSTGDEAGWLYGRVLGGPEYQGWFPEEVVGNAVDIIGFVTCPVECTPYRLSCLESSTAGTYPTFWTMWSRRWLVVWL